MTGRSAHMLLAEILTPSKRDENAYTWAVIAMGHVLLGAAIAAILYLLFGDGTPVVALLTATRLGIAVAYWVIKEHGDLRRGGSWLDGVVDTLFVGLGSLYAGPEWWPLAVWAAIAIGLVLRTIARG